MFDDVKNRLTRLEKDRDPSKQRGTHVLFLKSWETEETHEYTDEELKLKEKGQLIIFGPEYDGI